MADETSNQLLVPLHATTWDVDRAEGAVVNDLKATHTRRSPSRSCRCPTTCSAT